MSNEAEISIDVTLAQQALDRFNNLVKKNVRENIVLMARQIAGAAAATTKVSPKKRLIVKNNPDKSKNKEGVFWAKAYNSRNKLYYIGIVAQSKDVAKEHKRAIIFRRHLAKSAWFWILGAISGKGSSRSSSAVGPGVEKSARFFAVKKNINKVNPEILLHNKLNYTSRAFKTRGRATINDIGKRAANAFEHKMERQIARAIAASE